MNTFSNSIIYVPSSIQDARRMIKASVDFESLIERPGKEQILLDRAMSALKGKTRIPSFHRSDYGDVSAFFDEASADYDSDQLNPYWSFAHEILKFILTKFIAGHFLNTQSIRVFDAGAGTGNWSKFVLGLNDRVSSILFDMNQNMLGVAHTKIIRLPGSSAKIVEGNLEILSDFPSQPSNLVLCMHNVIGLGRNIPLILRNLYLYLEAGGMAFIMTTNKYHAFNFAIQYRGEDEARRVVSDGTIKFKNDMPEMFCYTPQEFKTLLETAGFEHVTVLGFPVTIYPSVEDTKLLRNETLENSLRNPDARNALLELEKRLCLNPSFAYRAGSSLIAICQKRT